MKNRLQSKKAFTIIEISIVLLIIGIIIAAVMSGGDIIRNAESKQFYQSFARKWTTVIDTYYDKMGQELCDGTVNSGSRPTKDGYFDGTVVGTNQLDQIKSAGINIDKIIAPGQGLRSEYIINGEFTGYQNVSVFLGAYQLEGTPYNFVILRDIPLDVAIAVDRYVDGVSDGRRGIAIAIQTDAATIALPANLIDLDPTVGTSLLLDYNEVTTTTKTTNVGILVEH